MTSKPTIGVVGVPGGWSTEALADAIEKRTGQRLVVDMARVSCDLDAGTARLDDTDLCKLDALVIKKVGARYSHHMLDRLETLRFVNQRGVPVFSRPECIIRLFDRLSCTVTLAAHGIPLPPTTITEDLNKAEQAIVKYGEAVLKPLYSTKARGMVLVNPSTCRDLRGELEKFRSAGNPTLYIQQKLSLPERDLGVVFLGGEHVGTYARVKSGSSWNTTTRDGGHYAPHSASPEIIDLAFRAQALFDMDLTSVDVVETPDGPRVFEVSAFGGFRGCLTALNIDLADRYADYVVQRAGR